MILGAFIRCPYDGVLTFTRPVMLIVMAFSPAELEILTVAKLEAVPLGVEDGIVVGYHRDSGKINRSGGHGLAGIDFSIIVVIVQHIILSRLGEKDADFIALAHGLGPLPPRGRLEFVARPHSTDNGGVAKKATCRSTLSRH